MFDTEVEKEKDYVDMEGLTIEVDRKTQINNDKDSVSIAEDDNKQ